MFQSQWDHWKTAFSRGQFCWNLETNVLSKHTPSSPNSTSINKLVHNFFAKTSDIIKTIAPTKVKIVLGKKKPRWTRDPTVLSLKRDCSQTERKWRKTKLKVYYKMYKNRLNRYHLTLKDPMESFFSEIINSNINNVQALFATVERLANSPMTEAPKLNFNSSCNEFASLFTAKILTIRCSVYTEIQNPLPMSSSINTNIEKMSVFHELK